jgi:hypothetical protein
MSSSRAMAKSSIGFNHCFPNNNSARKEKFCLIIGQCCLFAKKVGKVKKLAVIFFPEGMIIVK